MAEPVRHRHTKEAATDMFSLPLPRHISTLHDPAVVGGAERVCSARVVQTSTCSAMARASSTSIPRYLTVLSKQPRNLLSIARLNIARSRGLPSTWSFVRIDQTCFGRSGGFGPISLPLFHGVHLGAAAMGHSLFCMVVLLRCRESDQCGSRHWNHVGFRANPVRSWLPVRMVGAA